MADMTHRQRVMAALNHQEPDRVPVDFGSTTVSTIVSDAYERLKAHLGVATETSLVDTTSSRVSPDEAILQAFDVDTRMLPLEPPVKHSDRRAFPDAYTDHWGVMWQLTSDGRYYPVGHPFNDGSSIRDLDAHAWPDPDDPSLTAGLRARAEALRSSTDCAIVLELPGRVFSLGHYLCGFEDWLILLVNRPRFAEALLDRGVAIETQMVKNILEAVEDNVDVVLCQDDLGMQMAPLISPEDYRRLIKPRHKRLFDAIRHHTHAKLMLHSDGAVAPLIGDFIDVGVQVLNPVQVSAAGMMNTWQLKQEFGDHICFWGAVDTHRVLPFGSPAEVKDEVQRRINDLAPGGGYVLAAVHNIQADVPPENVCAMFESAMR